MWDTVEYAPDTPKFVTIYARAYDGENYSEPAELDIVVNNQDIDADDDGYPNSEDMFPNDPSEYIDSDGDGYGNNKDVFPKNDTEWADSDGDGYGDNSDLYPKDPSRHTTSEQLAEKEETDDESWTQYLWFIIAIIIIINILTFLFYINARRKEKNLKNKKP
jgi:hypothetical protein